MTDQGRTARAYLVWQSGYGALLTAYWILSSLYWVVDAELTPTRLILLGTSLELAVIVAEIPTGVVADAMSRKWSIVISMVVMGAGFSLTAVSTNFWPLVVSQVVWGIGWTFSSGADTAWITDELTHYGARQADIDRLLTRTARWGIYGAIGGLTVAGALGWVVGVVPVIFGLGVGMGLLGLYVATQFTEHAFTKSESSAFDDAKRIFTSGLRLARLNRTILLVLLVTVIFDFGAESVDRLTPKRLIDLGLPEQAEPIVWFTGIGVVGMLGGALVLHWVERRIEGERAPAWLFAGGCVVGAMGTFLLAFAPDVGFGIAGDIMTRGLVWTALEVIVEVWVNRETPSEVRATMQSFVGQAESAGEIVGGLTLAVVAFWAGVPFTLAVGAVLFLVSALVIVVEMRRTPPVAAIQ